MTNRMKLFLACLTAIYFATYPFLKIFFDAQNRYRYFWGKTEALELSVSVFTMALAAYLIYRLIENNIKNTFARNTLISVGFALTYWPIIYYDSLSILSSLFTNSTLRSYFPKLLPQTLPPSFLVIEYGIYSISYVLLWIINPEFIRKWIKNLFVIFSPAVIISLAQLFTYPSIPTQAGNVLTLKQTRTTGSSHVIFLLFDAWPYEILFDNKGNLVPEASKLNVLASQSIIAHSAHSPADGTIASIPQLLGTLTNKEETWKWKKSYMPDNIFSKAKTHGFKTGIIGSFLPYFYFYKDDIDYTWVLAGYKPKGNFIFAVAFNCIIACQVPLYTWMPSTYGNLLYWSGEAHHRLAVASLHKQVISLLDKMGNKTFLYFHYPIPHIPVLILIGPAREQTNLARIERKERDFQRFQHTAIQCLIENIEKLKEKDNWNDALVIVTSDHSNIGTHVPLFIKMPHQKKRVDSWKHYETKNIKNLLETAFKSSVGQKEILADREIAYLLSK